MNEETQFIQAPTGAHVWGISVRGWLAVLAIATVCAMAIMQIKVEEPLYTLSVAIVSFYYGQNQKKV